MSLEPTLPTKAAPLLIPIRRQAPSQPEGKIWAAFAWMAAAAPTGWRGGAFLVVGARADAAAIREEDGHLQQPLAHAADVAQVRVLGERDDAPDGAVHEAEGAA